MMRWGRRAAAAAVLPFALGLGACQPLARNHGYVPAAGALAALELGVDTRESVIADVGRPSTGGLIGDRGFYYVQSRFLQRGFLAPQEVEREVLAMTFAPDGTLGAIERFGLEDGRVVALSRRTTDEIFADRSLIRQILGNVGRIDPGAFVGEE